MPRLRDGLPEHRIGVNVEEVTRAGMRRSRIFIVDPVGEIQDVTWHVAQVGGFRIKDAYDRYLLVCKPYTRVSTYLAECLSYVMYGKSDHIKGVNL